MNDFSNLNSARSVAESKSNYPNSPEGKVITSLEETAKNTRELQELRRIANAAQQQAELSMSAAEASKKDARFSKRCSIFSLLIGIAGVIIALISLFIE